MAQLQESHVKENNKKNKNRELSLKHLLSYLNSFQSQELSSFIKSDIFDEIQKKPKLLEAFFSKVFFKDENEILETINAYIEEISQKSKHYDKGWKTVLPVIIKDLIEYVIHSLYQAIDWSQGIEDGREELDALYYFSHAEKRAADAIFKVILKQPVHEDTIYANSFGKIVCVGNKAYIVLHVEVQNQRKSDFGLRMFQMQYRLIDRYNTPIYSIAITSFSTNNVENFTYKVAETEIGCKFRCLNLLDFKTPKGKTLLAQMKAQKKLLPFVIDVHLFLFCTDKNEEGKISQKELDDKMRSLYEELENETLTVEEKIAFFKYLAELLELKGKDIEPLWEALMQTTPTQKQMEAHFEDLFTQKVAEYLEKQFNFVQDISREAKIKITETEARVKAETEARVKAETEARVKAETEARVKADSAYNYCELRNFMPQEKIRREDFVKLVISLGSQKASLVAHFAKDQGKSMDEVLSFISDLSKQEKS